MLLLFFGKRHRHFRASFKSRLLFNNGGLSIVHHCHAELVSESQAFYEVHVHCKIPVSSTGMTCSHYRPPCCHYRASCCHCHAELVSASELTPLSGGLLSLSGLTRQSFGHKKKPTHQAMHRLLVMQANIVYSNVTGFVVILRCKVAPLSGGIREIQ